MVESAEIFDRGGLRLLPTPKRLRLPLTTLIHVRDEMARCYRQMRAGDLDSSEGSKRVYVLGQIGKVIEGALLEQRIEALEQDVPRD